MEYRRCIRRNRCPLRDGGKIAAQILELAMTRRRYIQFIAATLAH